METGRVVPHHTPGMSEVAVQHSALGCEEMKMTEMTKGLFSTDHTTGIRSTQFSQLA